MAWNSVFAPKVVTETIIMPSREDFESKLLEGWEPFVVVFRKSQSENTNTQKERVVRYGVGPA